jgi:hypothetical protein
MKKSSNLIISCALFIFLIAVILTIPSMAFGQTSGMRGSTDRKNIDVLIEPSPAPVENKEQTTFKVAFLHPGTDSIVQHIDYDFVIMKDGKEIFKASAQAGQQQPIHSTEGTVTIPYKFEDQGDYLIKVTISGIRFLPIEPETATFPLKVTPEFPVGAAAAVFASAASMITVVTISANILKARVYRNSHQ